MNKATCVVALVAALGSALPALAAELREGSARELAIPPLAAARGIYRTSGVSDNGAGPNVGRATSFHCSNLSPVAAQIEFRIRNHDGTFAADKIFSVNSFNTFTASTHFTAVFFDDAVLSPGTLIDQGTASIFSTTPQLVCSAMIVDASSPTPVGISLHLQRFQVLPGSQE